MGINYSGKDVNVEEFTDVTFLDDAERGTQRSKKRQRDAKRLMYTVLNTCSSCASMH